jgi:hypothetical protein
VPDDGPAVDVDAAPASVAELVNLDDGLTDIDVMDLEDDVEKLVLGEVVELDVEVAVFFASEARIDVTSVYNEYASDRKLATALFVVCALAKDMKRSAAAKAQHKEFRIVANTNAIQQRSVEGSTASKQLLPSTLTC